jgi:hypothetical protein
MPDEPDIRMLVDAIYWERVARARNTPGEVKLLDGPRLFDRACRVMMAGIRDSFPTPTRRACARFSASVWRSAGVWRTCRATQ